MPPKLVAFMASLSTPRFINCLQMYLALSILRWRFRLSEPVALSAAPKRIKFWLCKLLYSHRKKSCCISFSSKGFKVITLYRIFEGCQVEDKPIIFLPATASEEELANAIFFCLGKSSMVIRTSINSTSAYLKFIKERSLKSYYQQSVACIVKLNVQTGIIHLELWQQADDGRGMTPCHEQSLMAFDVKGNSQLFAKYVMEILSERLALKKG